MNHRTQEQYLKDGAAKRRQQKAEADERLRTLCNGTRTVREIAARMGWKDDRTWLALKRLGLKAAKDGG